MDSAPETVCPRQITSRKAAPLGSTYLEAQLNYEHCLENELFLPWQMSFLSVLNLKGTNVLECLENVTPHSLPWVFTLGDLMHFDSTSCVGSRYLQKKKLRQQLWEKLAKVEILTNKDETCSCELFGGRSVSCPFY